MAMGATIRGLAAAVGDDMMIVDNVVKRLAQRLS
jgi:hypothetical protein